MDTLNAHGLESPPNRRRIGVMTRAVLGVVGIVVCAAALLAALEIALRIAGVGHSNRFFLERRIEGTDYLAVNKEFYQQFLSVPIETIMDVDDLGFMVPAVKPEGAFRIVILGSSAAHGCTPDFAYGFGRILEVLLRAQFPNVRFEVYNAACPGVNSHVMRFAARACTAIQPDLFVVYMGNNEFVGPFGPAWTGDRVFSARFIDVWVRLGDLRIAQGLLELGRRRWLPRAASTSDFVAQLKPFRRDSARRQAMYRQFGENLESICQAADKAAAPILLCTVGSEIRDWRPFASLHRDGIAPEQLAEWDAAFKAGQDFEHALKSRDAVAAYERAAAIDDTYAGLLYRMAAAYTAVLDYSTAWERLQQACDFDALPLRASRDINNVIAAAAGTNGPNGPHRFLVDTAGILAKATPHEELFWDFVHLKFHGNYLVARAIFGRVVPLLPERLRGLEAAAPGSVQGDSLEPVCLSEDDCRQRLALTPPVLLRHAKSMEPAFQFWGVPDENKAALKQLIADLERTAADAPRVEADGYARALVLNPQDYYLRARYAKALLQLKDSAGFGAVAHALREAKTLALQFPQRDAARRLLTEIEQRARVTSSQ